MTAKTLPPYLPNTHTAKKNWAWYHDNISEMDRQVGEILKKLEDDGLAENTLVVYWSDHGMGMPRGKRWLYDTGLHVPVIVRWPGHIKKGSVREDLVSLIDLTPTMLSVAGVTVPDYIHGRVIFGKNQQKEPDYLYFHRDRMDEAIDLFRAVRDRRFKYIRNFEPEKPYGQGIDYMDEMPAMRDWRRLAKQGRLKGGQMNWHAKTKPIEELYDTKTDPYELRNLANNPRHQKRLAAMRKALEEWQIRIGDKGLIPEAVLMQQLRPGNKYQKKATPKLSINPGNASSLVGISCPTEGASIAYAIVKKNEKPQWKLYVKPMRIIQGVTLRAKACRLGYRDSDIVSALLR